MLRFQFYEGCIYGLLFLFNAIIMHQFTYYLKNLYKKLTDFNDIPPVNQIGGNSLNEYHY